MPKRNRVWRRLRKWPLLAALGFGLGGLALALSLPRHIAASSDCMGPRGACGPTDNYEAIGAIVLVTALLVGGLVIFGLLTADDGAGPDDLPRP